MLGGILRALLAMCFSNVVFPLLNNNEMKKREHESVTKQDGGHKYQPPCYWSYHEENCRGQFMIQQNRQQQCSKVKGGPYIFVYVFIAKN